MGKLNPTLLRYLSYEDIAVLAGVELGMKNHELVTAPLAASLANLSGVHKILRELCKHRLLTYERGRKYDGYRLTNLGYDYLALHELTRRKAIESFGNQIGVGKESNIYVVANEEGEELCLKLHRLGRVCFRKVTEKRDYHKHAKALSWLYLSKISATKEFSYMKALYNEGFPVPRPINSNRHCVIMELVKGDLLNHILELKDPENLYEQLMDIIVRFASCGLIHGDFNEFNIMITEEENPIIIDFPQMMSTDHPDAEMYFNRDVECIKTFFRKRFRYESQLHPKLSEIKRYACLDEQVKCTGFTREMAKNMNIQLGLEEEECSEEGSDIEENCDEVEVNGDGGSKDSVGVEEALSNVNLKDSQELIVDEKNCDEADNRGRNDRGGPNNIAGIETWLSNICSNDSFEKTTESEDESDDCSIDEWISKTLLRDSQAKDEEVLSDYDDIRSVTSNGIKSQEVIKKYVRKQREKERLKQSRKRCLAKGEASAVNRSRKQNKDHIKQTKTLFEI